MSLSREDLSNHGIITDHSTLTTFRSLSIGATHTKNIIVVIASHSPLIVMVHGYQRISLHSLMAAHIT